MSDLSRSDRLHAAITDLLAQVPEIEAAAVVSFDGLPMASALPAAMDEDRVAAMSAALLSLGERAAEGLGRGALDQVYIEGEQGTVFLVSAADEAVLVAVAAKGAKAGMMLYEVRRAAVGVAEVLQRSDSEPAAFAAQAYAPPAAAPAPDYSAQPVTAPTSPPAAAEQSPVPAPPPQQVSDPLAPYSPDNTWPTYQPNGHEPAAAEPSSWS